MRRASPVRSLLACTPTDGVGAVVHRPAEGGFVASEGLHERIEDVTPDTVERHRAWVSLREELEAIDWYAQRIDATKDDALRAILTHNRDEEKEHAALVIAWLAKHDA